MKTISFTFCCAAALLGAVSLLAGSSEAPIRVRVDVDRPVLPAGATERAIVKIALDGICPPHRGDRPPVNLAIVIDRSGSMSGTKIAHAREAALEAVRRLSPDDIVSLIAYDTRVETLLPAQRVGDRVRLEEAICSLEAGGSTALYAGVTRAAAEVRRHLGNRRYVPRIILLSDGLANVGPSSPEELGRLGSDLVQEGISVTTVGLGLGFNEDLMTCLARRSDGNTYFVEDSADLPRIFAAELGDVLSVIARRVVITIEFPDGVRPLRLVGRDGAIRGRTAEVTLNQLYGGQEKYALVEVEVEPAAEGVEREIACARVSYEDAFNQRAVSATARRIVQFSASREAVVRSADHQVQADYAANVLAAAKDQAIALVDADRRDDAAALLRQKSEELQAMGEMFKNTAVLQSAAAAAPEADRLAREGLDNAQRKMYRTEASQIVNQQASGSSGNRR